MQVRQRGSGGGAGCQWGLEKQTGSLELLRFQKHCFFLGLNIFLDMVDLGPSGISSYLMLLWGLS